MKRTLDARVVRYTSSPDFDAAYFEPAIPPGVPVTDFRTGHVYRNDPWWSEVSVSLRAKYNWPRPSLAPLSDLATRADRDLDGSTAPPLDPAEWIQGEPFTLQERRGKVTLLYFSPINLTEPVAFMPFRLPARIFRRIPAAASGLEIMIAIPVPESWGQEASLASIRSASVSQSVV